MLCVRWRNYDMWIAYETNSETEEKKRYSTTKYFKIQNPHTVRSVGVLQEKKKINNTKISSHQKSQIDDKETHTLRINNI